LAGEIDPAGGRRKALDAFLETKLQEGAYGYPRAECV
jgi:hypothetical protein